MWHRLLLPRRHRPHRVRRLGDHDVRELDPRGRLLRGGVQSLHGQRRGSGDGCLLCHCHVSLVGARALGNGPSEGLPTSGAAKPGQPASNSACHCTTHRALWVSGDPFTVGGNVSRLCTLQPGDTDIDAIEGVCLARHPHHAGFPCRLFKGTPGAPFRRRALPIRLGRVKPKHPLPPPSRFRPPPTLPRLHHLCRYCHRLERGCIGVSAQGLGWQAGQGSCRGHGPGCGPICLVRL